MNHLAHSTTYTARPPRVPVLDGYCYDGKGFSSFPARSGFDRKRLLHGDFSQHTAAQTASFLQAWLYFGLLSTVLGPSFSQADFIHDDEEYGRTIITRNLPVQLQHCMTTFRDGKEILQPQVVRRYCSICNAELRSMPTMFSLL